MLAFALVAGACYPMTGQPVGSTGAMTPDTRLIGTWKGRVGNDEDDGQVYVHFLARDEATIEAMMVRPTQGDENGGWSNFAITTGKVGSRTYLNGAWLLDDGKPLDDAPPGTTPLYYRFEPGGRLRMFALDSDMVAAAVKSGEIAGTVKEGWIPEIHVTADSAALDAFIAAHDPQALFSVDFATLEKID